MKSLMCPFDRLNPFKAITNHIHANFRVLSRVKMNLLRLFIKFSLTFEISVQFSIFGILFVGLCN